MKPIIYLVLVLAGICPAFSQNRVTLSGYGENLKENDTVTITVYRQNVFSVDQRMTRKQELTIKNHAFFLIIDSVKSVETLSLNVGKNPEIDYGIYLIMPGDNIHLIFKNNEFTVTGNQSNFFWMQKELRQIELDGKIPHFKAGNLSMYRQVLDSVCQEQLQFLRARKSQIIAYESKILEDEIIASPRYRILNAMFYLLKPFSPDDRVKNFYLDFKSQCPPYNYHQFVSILGIEYIYNQYKIDSCVLLGKPFNTKSFLQYVRANLQGAVRERLLIYALLRDVEFSGNVRGELENFMQETKDPSIKEILSEYITNAIDGSVVYDFSLPNTRGENVRLSDFKGTPVVIDFWFTGCGACRLTAPILKEVENNFKGKKVVFLSISIDKNMEAWKKSVATGQYTSPGICNLNAGVSNDGTITVDRLKVNSFPTILIVDKNGKLNSIKINPQLDEGKSLTSQIESML